MKGNAISEDFPLPKAKYENIFIPTEKPIIHIKKDEYGKNCYNNESPDFFRLDTMTENKNGYKNPYLDEVISFDRNENFKKMDFNRNQIKLIDFIKSRREYSQNPKILKYIRTDFDITMQEKRERNLKERLEPKVINKYTITEGNDPERYNTLLTKINDVQPKLPVKLKNSLIFDDMQPLNKSYNINGLNKKKLEKFICDVDPMKSSYLKNLNDYKISEADKYDENSMFYYNKKPLIEYNAIKDKVIQIDSPPYMSKKWDNFYQNFFMLQNNDLGFQRKGGLFSEFNNKNIHVIRMNQRERKERKLEEEAKKNKLNKNSNNNSNINKDEENKNPNQKFINNFTRRKNSNNNNNNNSPTSS
jgi:hypothetical protein